MVNIATMGMFLPKMEGGEKIIERVGGGVYIKDDTKKLLVHVNSVSMEKSLKETSENTIIINEVTVT